MIAFIIAHFTESTLKNRASSLTFRVCCMQRSKPIDRVTARTCFFTPAAGAVRKFYHLNDPVVENFSSRPGPPAKPSTAASPERGRAARCASSAACGGVSDTESAGTRASVTSGYTPAAVSGRCPGPQSLRRHRFHWKERGLSPAW